MVPYLISVPSLLSVPSCCENSLCLMPNQPGLTRGEVLPQFFRLQEGECLISAPQVYPNVYILYGAVTGSPRVGENFSMEKFNDKGMLDQN